jgi:hypothetical protein
MNDGSDVGGSGKPTLAESFLIMSSVDLFPIKQDLLHFLVEFILTLPTDKSGGFSVQPPQPAPARSYTVSPSV